MFIIFDLDDTLIDTSGTITPVKLEAALKRLIQAGMNCPDYSAAWERLQRIDYAALSGRHALNEFLELYQAPHHFLEIGLKELYTTSCSDLQVAPCRGACELLSDLTEKNLRLAIVTVGNSEIQKEKIKKAGIDPALFSKIIVCEKPQKGPHYQALVEELGVSPSEVVVCGDKVSIDLSPAKVLGYSTVHVRWGRGRNHTEPRSDVDYVALELMEIKEIVSSLKNAKSSSIIGRV